MIVNEQRLVGDMRVIGWRERVGFPDWNIRGVETKIDTGARTSALHVENLRRIGSGRIRFEVVLNRKKPVQSVSVEASPVRTSLVRSSSGHRQYRYVVRTRIHIGNITRTIELSLVRRGEMICRMLLGRTALEGFAVDVCRKYVLSERIRKMKREGRE